MKAFLLWYLTMAAVCSIGVIPGSFTVRQKVFYIGFWPALCWRGFMVIIDGWIMFTNATRKRR